MENGVEVRQRHCIPRRYTLPDIRDLPPAFASRSTARSLPLRGDGWVISITLSDYGHGGGKLSLGTLAISHSWITHSIIFISHSPRTGFEHRQ